MGKGEKTKQIIIDQSRKLFAEKGFDSTKTSEIAKVSGISEATIYKYFNSKTDLLLACVTPLEEKKDEQQDYSQTPLKDLIKMMVEKIISNRTQFEILFNEALHHPDISTQYIERIHHQGPIEKEIEKRIQNQEISTISNYLMFNVGLIGSLLAMMKHHEIHAPNKENFITSSKIQEIIDFIYYGLCGGTEVRRPK
ncbi:TetR/AcrR family transcriptional regulator [Heyndrickxia sp. NPDC080065]|uniref:TetR/AcrR family transcriptional regulator n=1 Tax=Heyndrickxia sp. NPDC080065 TaxID=3390568 RepID=UPI003D0877FB